MALSDPLTGSYNGLAFGPGGAVAVAESDGVDDMPELRISDQDNALEGMVRGSDYARRRVCSFKWLLIADTPADLPALRTAVQQACKPRLNDELPLVIANNSRELRCRPRSLKLPRQHDVAQRWIEAVVEFYASDPWWYDVSDSSQDFAIGTPATFFPLFPMRLASSDVFADTTIDNTGDVEAWPVWIITGPATSIVLRNLTTGKLLTIAVPLSAGETVTVDTTRGVKTILTNTGFNAFGLATGNLWPLAEGSNSVRLEMSGATAASTISLRWRRRWMAGV